MAHARASSDSTLAIERFEAAHWAAAVFAAITGIVHLYLGVILLGSGATARFGGVSLGIGFNTLFLIGGVGYFVGLGVFLTRYWRRAFYLLAAAYPGLMIIWWLANGTPLFTVGAPDKVIQLLLVITALYLYRQEADRT